MKWILLLSFLILGSFSVVFEFGGQPRIPDLPGKERLVESEPTTVFAAGRVEGVTREIELFTTIRELVTHVSVREGECILAGQLIVQLDDRVQKGELDLAKAGVLLAEAERKRLVHGSTQSERDEAQQQCEHREAEMNSAAKMLERGKLLANSSSISSTEVEEYESRARSTKALYEAAKAHQAVICNPPRNEDLDASDARLAAAKARLNLAEAALSKTRITAPCNGQILQINVEIGELPSEKPLVIMCDTQTLQGRASVDEFDALRVQIGQPVRLQTNAMRGADFYGRVVRISPRMHRKQVSSDRPTDHLDTRSREIWVEIEDGVPLIVGLPVELWIDQRDPGNSSTL